MSPDPNKKGRIFYFFLQSFLVLLIPKRSASSPMLPIGISLNSKTQNLLYRIFSLISYTKMINTIMWILAIIWILDIRIQIQYVNFVFTKYSLTIFFSSYQTVLRNMCEPPRMEK